MKPFRMFFCKPLGYKYEIIFLIKSLVKNCNYMFGIIEPHYNRWDTCICNGSGCLLDIFEGQLRYHMFLFLYFFYTFFCMFGANI